MSSVAIQRRIYRTILSLHPAPFRERFSAEMLWIFDATIVEVGMVRLVADGLSSLLRQWTAQDAPPQRASSAFQCVPTRAMSITTLAQAAVLASGAIAGFFTLLQQAVPLPQPPRTFAVRRASLDLCGEANNPAHTRQHLRRQPMD